LNPDGGVVKILVSVAVWGREYATTFAEYSLASQLSPNNIPRLAVEHDVTYHIVTTRRDAAWLREKQNIVALEKFGNIIWDCFEDRGYDPFFIPKGLDEEKYPFLSRLQNLAFECSVDYDILVFNYADFIWADGSLYHSILLMNDGADALLGFCLPVDRDAGKPTLNRYRIDRNASSSLDLPCRTAVGLAIDHMHREARLRIWGGKEFSSFPSYLLWRVGEEGFVIRAYHQTVLALRVKANDPEYKKGIRRGSLDGYFTAVLAETGRVHHATDSDTVTVFSLYHTRVDSRITRHESREEALRQCLRDSISEGQRRFAEIPIQFKRAFSESSLWDRVTEDSCRTLLGIHQATPADHEAFARVHNYHGDIEALERRWRKQAILDRWKAIEVRSWFYRRIVVRFLGSRSARLARSVIGPRARAWRVGMEKWIFGSRA
jgi:hypothetical protein